MIGREIPTVPPAPETGRRVLAGGIVAHNEEARIERSIRSLLAQELPSGTEWGRIWVVASGCTDRTVEVARNLASEDPRLGLIEEPRRRGKSAALAQVLARAEGDWLVLLNSDAAAAPGAVDALLSQAQGKPRPFAIMGRPTVERPGASGWTGTMRWMWELHHELHGEMLRDGRGAHLSDELWLLSLPSFPWVEDGIVNDGSYCAVWLQSHGGGCWYSPEAQVAVEVPRTARDHLRQRRRIHAGNAQVSSRLGRSPTTALRYLFHEPRRTVRAARRTLTRRTGWAHLARIGVLELVAHALAVWDQIPPRRDHVLWERIAAGPVAGGGEAVRPDPPAAHLTEVERRIRVLTGIAADFGVQLPSDRLVDLLPTYGPSSVPEIDALMEAHPGLMPTGDTSRESTPVASDRDREQRGVAYRLEAERLLSGPLRPLVHWTRCVGLTGSTAYGEPAAGDDLDFFVVTRPGTVALFLAGTYLAIRLDRWRRGSLPGPETCFNYVVDAGRVGADLAAGRGLLFAREALMARMLRGERYYQGLLARVPALGEEFPRLYAARTAEPERGTDVDPPPILVRALSAGLFVPLAAYLQLAGLLRNWRVRTGRAADGAFRTSTTPTRIAFLSEKFERLRERYDAPTGDLGGAAAPSRIPSAR